MGSAFRLAYFGESNSKIRDNPCNTCTCARCKCLWLTLKFGVNMFILERRHCFLHCVVQFDELGDARDLQYITDTRLGASEFERVSIAC